MLTEIDLARNQSISDSYRTRAFAKADVRTERKHMAQLLKTVLTSSNPIACLDRIIAALDSPVPAEVQNAPRPTADLWLAEEWNKLTGSDDQLL